MKDSLESKSLQQKSKIRKDRDLERFRENNSFKFISWNQSQEGWRRIIWRGVIENLNEQWKFSEGEASIFCGPLDLVDMREG